MLYLSQLGDGKMLVLSDEGNIEVATTGYPYPDCCVMVDDVLIRGQLEVLRVVLGYELENFSDFIKEMQNLEPTPFLDWKHRVQSENIGGGCPIPMQRYAKYKSEGLDSLCAFYKMLIPMGYEREDIKYPDSDWLSENSSYFAYGFDVLEEDNKLLYSHLNCVDMDFLDILKDTLVSNSMYVLPKYVVSLEGYQTGMVLFTSDIADNCDLVYLYRKMYDLSEEDFVIKVSLLDSTVSISCSSKTDKGKKKMQEESIYDFFGSYQRFTIEGGELDYFKEV